MAEQHALQNRIAWVDWARCLGIGLIVWGHFLPGGVFAKVILYSFHVPLFFALSGFMYSSGQPFSEWVVKRFKRLIVPFIFYLFLSLPVYLFMYDSETVHGLVRKIFFLDGLTIWNSPLWYLPVLFFTELLFAALDRVIGLQKRVVWLIIVCAAFLALALLIYQHYGEKHTFVFGLSKVVLFFPFYGLGVLMKKASILFKPRLWVSILASVVFIGFCVATGLINRGNNISVYLFDINNCYVFIVGAYVGVISFILILSSIKKVWTIVRLISEKTLFIMCTHYFFSVVVYTKIVEKNTSLKGTLAGLCTMLFYAVLLYVWEQRSKLVQRLKVFRGGAQRL